MMYTEIGKLLKGYKDENDVIHTEIEYREMDGTDEEAVSKPKIKDNGALITRTILERCLIRIGTIEKKDVKPNEWTSIIQSLAIGDQDYAFMQIRDLSLGDEIKLSHTCPHCKNKINSTYKTEEIPLTPYNGLDEIEFELPRGYRDKEGNIHKIGILRQPIGLDREILSKMITQNPSMANTLLLARCIKKIGDVHVTDDVLRKLSLRDRNFLYELIQDNVFGYDIQNFEIECPSCGKSLVISFNQTDFL